MEVPGPIPGPITHLEAIYRPGTRRLAAPRPVTRLGAVTPSGTRQPAVSGPIPRSICSMITTSYGILQPTVPVTVPGPVTLLETVPVPGTRHPAVPVPVPRPVACRVTVLTSRTLPTSSPGLVILWSLMTVSRMYCLLALKRKLRRLLQGNHQRCDIRQCMIALLSGLP